MKIVVATPLYPPDIGGPATYASILAEELPKMGVEVRLVKFGDVRHLPKLLRHYAYYRRVLAASKGADVVLALDPVSVGLPALKAAKKAGKPFVVKIVGDYAWEQGVQRFGVTLPLDEFVRTAEIPFAVRPLRATQKQVAESARRIIVPSEYLKKIVMMWGVAENKIEVIYNAVPDIEIGEVPKAVRALTRPLVVSVGRLVPWKQFDSLIDVVAKAGNLSLAIVGAGPEQERLRTYAREKLGGGAVFTGQLSKADTLATIKHADAFVLNSSYEGLSHVLIEALQLGVPIVTTRSGGNAELIAHRENGMLVPSGDPEALQAAIVQLLADQELRVFLRANALTTATRFSKEAMLNKTVDLFSAV